ncbi:MAG: hypothetical protein ACP59X_15740 [Solidesulfovibrio sp. DCME]|uniref:hypothetical protein n=1 Tax=Solidesulfovibrio sp. DCME TaxID=3447380 RepID=UPI003D0C0AD8
MLRELFALWRDRGSAVARRLGQDREAVSIDARHRRCRAAWASHLEATKALVLEAAGTAPGHGTALVLGSGACLDVPVAGLAARFAEVVLVDAHHPRPARRLAREHPQVRLVTADATGLAETARLAAKGRLPLPLPVPPPDPVPGLRPDFTASVNLASQLPIPFYGLLGRAIPEQDRQAFYRGLVAAHCDWLAGLPGRVCLVCDTAWERVAAGALLESRDALEGLRLPPPDRAWCWSIAPSPEESHAYDRQNRVAGFLDFAAAWRAWRLENPGDML